MSHYVMLCPECRAVMQQCRCPGPKETQISVRACMDCIVSGGPSHRREHVWVSNGDWLPMSCKNCRRPQFSMSDIHKVYDGTRCDGNDRAQTEDDLVAAEAALRNIEVSARYARERVAGLRARLVKIPKGPTPRLCGRSGKDTCDDCVGSCGVEEA